METSLLSPSCYDNQASIPGIVGYLHFNRDVIRRLRLEEPGHSPHTPCGIQNPPPRAHQGPESTHSQLAPLQAFSNILQITCILCEGAQKIPTAQMGTRRHIVKDRMTQDPTVRSHSQNPDSTLLPSASEHSMTS